MKASMAKSGRLASWAAIAAGILVKGLIAAVFPMGTAFFYLLFSGLWRKRQTWRRLSILPGILVMLAIAAPWHVLATLRNPPYFDFSMHAESRLVRHGFFWFLFFSNEHILRFIEPSAIRTITTPCRPCSSGCCTSPTVQLPVERLPGACRGTDCLIAARIWGLSHAAFSRCLLDRHRPRVFLAFHHAGVLLDARISGDCPAYWKRDGGIGRARVEDRDTHRGQYRGGWFRGHCGAPVGQRGLFHAGRYLARRLAPNPAAYQCSLWATWAI